MVAVVTVAGPAVAAGPVGETAATGAETNVAAPGEPNPPDPAAAEPAATNAWWLRGLFFAFGGLIAVGSALRFFL